MFLSLVIIMSVMYFAVTALYGNALFGEGTGSIVDVTCGNFSSDLLNCSITASSRCSFHTSDVSICCSFGEIKLSTVD